MDSQTVFQLRNEAKDLIGPSKIAKLNEAFNVGKEVYSQEPLDEWNQKAYAWILIDLCKYYIALPNLGQCKVYFDLLNMISFDYPDDIIENQKSYLIPRVDAGFQEINYAEQLSKQKRHQEALNIFKTIISTNRLAVAHHEAYGWIIYRFLKDKETDLTSIQVRTFLKDYINLSNERPSLLHSIILNFALHYSRVQSHLNLYMFFKLWGPENLREEDKEDQPNNENPQKPFPSLVARLLRQLVEGGYDLDLDYLTKSIQLKTVNKIELYGGMDDFNFRLRGNYESLPQVLDMVRKPFFWKLFNLSKENKFTVLWNHFEIYNSKYRFNSGSLWHSEVLSLAERLMVENDEWRFLKFFEEWNPDNLLTSDWKQVKKDENTYNGLAVKALKKAFHVVKSRVEELDLTWLLNGYKVATDKFPDDEWLLREKALLHIKSSEIKIAEEVFRDLVLSLGGKYYVWQEYSNCFDKFNVLKIAMLSKAITLERNEDFLGDLRLELAESFLIQGFKDAAVVELQIYKSHRESKSWNLSPTYKHLKTQLEGLEASQKDNKQLYLEYVIQAEEYAYEHINWVQVVMTRKWSTSKGVEKMDFTDGKSLSFSVQVKKFEILSKALEGDIFSVKLYSKESGKERDNLGLINLRNLQSTIIHHPLMVRKSTIEPWSILEESYAYVNYINKEKGIVHAVTYKHKEVFFKQEQKSLRIGDYIIAKEFTKEIRREKRTELRQIKKIIKQEVLPIFPVDIAVVDHVNEQKKLFHFVINHRIQGVIKFNETSVKPKEADFLQVHYVTRKNKNGVTKVQVLHIEPTTEGNTELVKEISGDLKVKFKIGEYTYDSYEHEYLEEEETLIVTPSFGFIGDYYVPRNLLKKHGITENKFVEAKALFTGNKWKVFELIIK